MKNLFYFLTALILISCGQSATNGEEASQTVKEPKRIIRPAYELVVPNNANTLLILFPCSPCNADNTKIELGIEEEALKKGIAVMYMNFNQHLWLTATEKGALEVLIAETIKENDLPANNIFIGGVSGGGNVAILLSDFLAGHHSPIQPKGVFVVDSPLDLLGLKENAEKNIAKNFSEMAVNEGKWILDLYRTNFGVGDSAFANIEEFSPYVFKTHSLHNVSHLNGIKIRVYTEPDTLWWKENRLTDYEDMNAHYLEELSKDLQTLYGKNVEFITTKNKGVRRSGERHPHSWAIVDNEDLLRWMSEN